MPIPALRGLRLDPETEVVGEDRQNNQAEQEDQDRNDNDDHAGKIWRLFSKEIHDTLLA